VAALPPHPNIVVSERSARVPSGRLGLGKCALHDCSHLRSTMLFPVAEPVPCMAGGRSLPYSGRAADDVVLLGAWPAPCESAAHHAMCMGFHYLPCCLQMDFCEGGSLAHQAHKV
jgi:hypothetical protein